MSIHNNFRAGGVGAGPSRVAYATDYTADPDARDCVGHGTNVASIAAGYDAAPDGNSRFGMGVAPWARVGASKIFRCNGSFGLSGTAASYRGVAGAAWDRGARISNNSWGDNRWGEYTTTAQEYDRLVRDSKPGTGANQQMVEVFAAGNDGVGVGNGSIDSPGTAKNVITVGASENIRSLGTDACGVSDAEANDADDLLDLSSRGPTDDLRVKPDLVAPGTHVTGARPSTAGLHRLLAVHQGLTRRQPAVRGLVGHVAGRAAGGGRGGADSSLVRRRA